jgi:hypothetical protein
MMTAIYDIRCELLSLRHGEKMVMLQTSMVMLIRVASYMTHCVVIATCSITRLRMLNKCVYYRDVIAASITMIHNVF